MHISDGVLSTQVLAAGWTAAAAGTAIGLKKLDPERIVPVAVFSSAFFLASLVHVKIGPSSTHLSLIALSGLALGWAVFPAVLTALLLQALLFQFGGILSLGPNCVNIAVPALLTHLLFGRATRSANPLVAGSAAFSAGTAAVLLCAAQVALFLGLSNDALTGTAKIVFAAHIPLALIEGAVTVLVVAFLRKAAPDLLRGVEKS